MKSTFWTRLTLLGLGTFFAGAADGALKVGDKAPDFSLTGTDGLSYSLADFRGRRAVVLAWFPKADTPGCTKECKSFQEHRVALKQTNAATFAVSVDSVAGNRKFAAKYGFADPILSDPEKTVARAYGVLGPLGVARRWTFYIDRDGVIRAIDKAINTSRAGIDVAAKLKELGIAAE